MTKVAQGTAREKNHILPTSGEIFSDGSAIELVTTGSANGKKLALLSWNGEKAIIAPRVAHRGQLYQPIELHHSLQHAIRFPSGVVAYGTARELFTGVAKLFERCIGFSRSESMLLTLWVTTTWFADRLSSPPTLLVSGPDMAHAVTLFRLLDCVCRHSLMLGEISFPAIRSLPMVLRPTLIVNQPELSPKLRALWRTSNFRGMFVIGNGGTVLDLVCSKAVFVGMEGAADSWSDAALHLALPPLQTGLPPLDEGERTRIANRFQPRFLRYRLRYLREVSESRSVECQAKFPNSELARNLLACVLEDTEIAQTVAPLLQSQEQDILARCLWDPNLAVVEVVGTLSHQRLGEASITHVTELTNALLRSRGETLVYSPEEIGWKLRSLGISRSRGRNCMVLQFSREMSRRIHQLARQLGMTLARGEGCPDCAQPEVVAG